MTLTKVCGRLMELKNYELVRTEHLCPHCGKGVLWELKEVYICKECGR